MHWDLWLRIKLDRDVRNMIVSLAALGDNFGHTFCTSDSAIEPEPNSRNSRFLSTFPSGRELTKRLNIDARYRILGRSI